MRLPLFTVDAIILRLAAIPSQKTSKIGLNIQRFQPIPNFIPFTTHASPSNHASSLTFLIISLRVPSGVKWGQYGWYPTCPVTAAWSSQLAAMDQAVPWGQRNVSKALRWLKDLSKCSGATCQESVWANWSMNVTVFFSLTVPFSFLKSQSAPFRGCFTLECPQEATSARCRRPTRWQPTCAGSSRRRSTPHHCALRKVEQKKLLNWCEGWV